MAVALTARPLGRCGAFRDRLASNHSDFTCSCAYFSHLRYETLSKVAITVSYSVTVRARPDRPLPPHPCGWQHRPGMTGYKEDECLLATCTAFSYYFGRCLEECAGSGMYSCPKTRSFVAYRVECSPPVTSPLPALRRFLPATCA
jgi:hypothetical protein